MSREEREEHELDARVDYSRRLGISAALKDTHQEKKREQNES